MSRTLVTDGCHELCLLHLSDLNRVRHSHRAHCWTTDLASLSLTSNVIIPSITENDPHHQRSSTTRYVVLDLTLFALSIIHYVHGHLSAHFSKMLLTHWSLHVHDHSGVVLEGDEGCSLRCLDFFRQISTTDITFNLSTGFPFFT